MQHVERIFEHLTRNPFAGSLEEWVAAIVVTAARVRSVRFMVNLPYFWFFMKRMRESIAAGFAGSGLLI